MALGITSCNNIRSNINFQVDTTDIYVPDSIKFIVNFDEGSQSFRSYKLRGKESIGVFVKEQSGKMLLNNAQFTNNKDEHKLFTTNRPNDILLTNEHKDLTIAAYYPYSDNTPQDGILDIDLTNQSDGKSRELLTATTSSADGYRLLFKHRLTALDFIVDGVSPEDKISATIKGAQARGYFDLLDNQFKDIESSTPIEAGIYKPKNVVHIAANIIPNHKKTELNLLIRIDGKTRTCKIPSQSFEEGKKYTLTLKLKGDHFIVDQISYLEIPVVPTASNYKLIRHYEPLEDTNDSKENPNVRNYTYLYDTKHKIALWVAYPLHQYYLGDFSRKTRKDPWHYDYTLGEHFQNNVSRGYRSSDTKCDRGHQLPSADRTRNEAYNRTTFTSANCTAQFAYFNRGVWEGLERKVRSYQSTLSGVGLDTLYVVTGAGLGQYPGMPQVEQPVVKDANGHQVTVPTYYYKALAIRTKGGGFETMAFILPNDPNIKKKDYNKYRISVSQLEKYTGFRFFPGIPQNAKNSTTMKGW